mgnify:FL=1
MTNLTTVRAEDMGKVHNIDCMDFIPKLSDLYGGYVKCIVTSPPYNLGGDFHTMVSGKRVTYGDYDSPYKDNLEEEEYQKWQIDVLNMCYDALTDDGIMFYNHKNRIKNGSIINPLQWIERSKFNVYQVVVLNFKSTANVDKRRFFPVHEYLYILTKDNKTKLNNINNLTDVWEMKKVPRRVSGHPAVFHEDLPLRCIEVSTEKGDLVFDPFAGTGTTLIAGKRLGRQVLGCEISEKYTQIANERLSKITIERLRGGGGIIENN